VWHFFGWQKYAEGAGLLAAIAIAAAWEASTYFSSERSTTGLFPLGRKLLRDNAIIATLYMSLGAVVGFGFHVGIPWGDIIVLVICTVLAIWLAPKWLRQKDHLAEGGTALSIPAGRHRADHGKGRGENLAGTDR
jgi:hypothetical protein